MLSLTVVSLSISLLSAKSLSAKSRHIDVMHHFVRDRVAIAKGEIVMEYCPMATKEMVADILTKALPLDAFRACRKGLGMRG